MKQHSYVWAIASSVFCSHLAAIGPVQAQGLPVVPDRTLPTNSIVTPRTGNTLEITGGTTPVGGSNLFHSFSQFGVPTGGTVYFNNSLNIQNIFTRITGSSVSNIDGKLQANGTANLFLLNPNGIVFGPNASLNIGGSFLATTASSVNFADGEQFSASAPQTTPLLTVSVPIGLQFGSNPGSIVDRSIAPAININPNSYGNSNANPHIGGLQVTLGKTLALIGGNLDLQGGYLTAPQGRIELGSVAGSSLVNITPTASGWNLGYNNVQNFQNITLSQGAVVDASGDGGGNIQVQGKQVTLTDYSVIQSLIYGSSNGGEIFIQADRLNLDASGIANSSGIGVPIAIVDGSTYSSGKGSDITLKTRQLVVQNGAQINANSQGDGTGQGGKIDVTADESIEMAGTSADGQFPSGIGTTAFGNGNAGSMTLTTNGQLILRDGAEVLAYTYGAGNGGNLTVRAGEVRVIGIASNRILASKLEVDAIHSTGNGGSLSIETGKLIVLDGGQVSATTFSSGKGGNVSVAATDSIKLSGTAQFTNAVHSSGLFSDAKAAGDAGSIKINTGQLIVQNGATVSVTASSSSTGNGGNIDLTAGTIKLDNGGTILSQTYFGGGGNLTIHANDIILRHFSPVSATVSSGSGNGGNVNVKADTLVALENSNITANAYQGAGGNIQINIQGIFLAPNALITASSQYGVQGVVQVNTPTVDPSKGLTHFTTTVVTLPPLASGCSAGKGSQNNFSVKGRGGLPADPTKILDDETLLTNFVTLPTGSVPGASAVIPQPLTIKPQLPLVEATGWIVNEKGEVVLIVNAPYSGPQNPWTTPPNCNGNG